jgi:hypothetical protein
VGHSVASNRLYALAIGPDMAWDPTLSQILILSSGHEVCSPVGTTLAICFTAYT